MFSYNTPFMASLGTFISHFPLILNFIMLPDGQP